MQVASTPVTLTSIIVFQSSNCASASGAKIPARIRNAHVDASPGPNHALDGACHGTVIPHVHSREFDGAIGVLSGEPLHGFGVSSHQEDAVSF